MKQADIVPAYKKKSKLYNKNYRPISILSNVSKIYEWRFYDQIATYFEPIFSRYQCGFRKDNTYFIYNFFPFFDHN